jgi:hypothetical protein
MGECPYCVWVGIGCVGDVVIIVDVVVIQLNVLRSFTIFVNVNPHDPVRSVWYSQPNLLRHRKKRDVCLLGMGVHQSIMDHGGLDLRNLEGFLPFQCSSLPDRVDPLAKL